jgi:hypothetical protein
MARGLLVMTLICLLSGAVDDTFFSGIVVALTKSEVSVRRRALVSNETTQTFAIGSDTKIEGKLRVKANVTVRYVTDDEGHARALGIIVR